MVCTTCEAVEVGEVVLDLEHGHPGQVCGAGRPGRVVRGLGGVALVEDVGRGEEPALAVAGGSVAPRRDPVHGVEAQVAASAVDNPFEKAAKSVDN